MSKFPLLLICCLGSHFLPRTIVAQSEISPQELLHKVAQSFFGGQGLTSINLSGSARRIAGALDETGEMSLSASADGTSSLEMNLTSGKRTESQGPFADGQPCFWSGVNGINHPASAHNCAIPFAWFIPELGLFSPQRSPNGTFSTQP